MDGQASQAQYQTTYMNAWLTDPYNILLTKTVVAVFTVYYLKGAILCSCGFFIIK